MALLQVRDFQSFSEVHGQILPVRHRHLVNRTNHYNFGSKTQEFVVPPGLEVSDFTSGIRLTANPINLLQALGMPWFKFYTPIVLSERFCFLLNYISKQTQLLGYQKYYAHFHLYIMRPIQSLFGFISAFRASEVLQP